MQIISQVFNLAIFGKLSINCKIFRKWTYCQLSVYCSLFCHLYFLLLNLRGIVTADCWSKYYLRSVIVIILPCNFPCALYKGTRKVPSNCTLSPDFAGEGGNFHVPLCSKDLVEHINFHVLLCSTNLKEHGNVYVLKQNFRVLL